MASAVDSSGLTAASCDNGTAIVRPCHRISTSISVVQASSGVIRWTSTLSPLPERRSDFRSDARGLKRELDFVIEVAMPPHDQFFRSISVRDGVVVDSTFPDRVLLWLLHDFASRIRRTEVRPISNRRAISALLMPARCNFRT